MKNTQNWLGIRPLSSTHTALVSIVVGTIVLSACDADSERALLADTESDGESTDSDGGANGDDGAESGTAKTGLKETTGFDGLDTDTSVRSGRFCTYDNDCVGSCFCNGNQCAWPPIGPVPPAGYCDQAPVRSCSDASDCRDSCLCLDGACVQGVLPGPLPPLEFMPRCHLPPPDSYEDDDKWPNWSAYLGTPQVHSFHDAGDRDWVAVYFGVGGSVRFETYGLKYGANTKLKVFEFASLVKGALVGINDDIGGPWWVAESVSSRVDIKVPSDSFYLVKIINKSDPEIYTTSSQFPEYNFKISYN